MARQQSPFRTVGEDGEDGEEGKRGSDRWVWFITGPTACGKTTVAKYLADKLGLSFVEGDDFHPQANRDKMARNEPLTDEDRAAWLDALHERVVVSSTDADADGVPVPRLPHRVVTCSALKRRYRDALRGGDPVRTAPARVRFVFLDVHEEVLRQRARERKGHFAGEGLVKSQVEALERPGEDEEDVIIVRVENGEGVGETEREVLNRVVQQMGLE